MRNDSTYQNCWHTALTLRDTRYFIQASYDAGKKSTIYKNEMRQTVEESHMDRGIMKYSVFSEHLVSDTFSGR